MDLRKTRIPPPHDFSCPPNSKLLISASLRFGSSPPPHQLGIWPSFWLLGADFRGNYHNWPSVSEIGIAESINGQNTLWQVLHCGFAPGGPCNEFDGIDFLACFPANGTAQQGPQPLTPFWKINGQDIVGRMAPPPNPPTGPAPTQVSHVNQPTNHSRAPTSGT
ncbi:hypothetical protein B0T21DRAFT_351740 [Apiosordaria backusii]|uniref:Uncharacterized protein n=1 Tax=Apiosordaria backusii TaxID=314023 RepID=A0AA40ANA6_9PEZI|nr:hypothetical protein B0T21DRAFT_351740 [Apiosordaria backusii]